MAASRTGDAGGKREGAGRPKGIPNPNAGRKSKNGKMISIRLSGEALAKLEQLASAQGTSKTEVIEGLLLKFNSK